MRTTVIALVMSTLLFSSNAFTSSAEAAAAAKVEQESSQWHHVAESIALGSRVKVHLVDGKHVNGTLMRVDDTSVLVKKNTRMPEPAVTVTFDRIERLERDAGGVSFAKAIGIAAATGAGIMVTLFVNAMQID